MHYINLRFTYLLTYLLNLKIGACDQFTGRQDDSAAILTGSHACSLANAVVTHDRAHKRRVINSKETDYVGYVGVSLLLAAPHCCVREFDILYYT